MNKNVPNILTMSRIACTPLVVLFFLLPIPHGIGKFIAFAIYGIACFTDLLDGKIARKYNLVSDFGKFMDQIADKFITTTAMTLVLFSNIVADAGAIVMLLIVVLRDILLGGIRMVAANKNIVISADIFGKLKSTFLDTSNAILMFYVGLSANVDNTFSKVIKVIGLVLLIIGVVLAVFSCINYSKNAIVALNKQKNPNAEEKPFNADDYIMNALKICYQNTGLSSQMLERKFNILPSQAFELLELLQKNGYIYRVDGERYFKIKITSLEFRETFGEDISSDIVGIEK